MSQQTYASAIDELSHWVTSVGELPAFLRTREARELLDALTSAGFGSSAGLGAQSLERVATAVGRTSESLLEAIRKCPFGVSFG